MSMIISHKERQNAEEAYRILSSPVFLRAMKAAEDGLTKRWKGAGTAVEREALWRDLQALYRIETELRRILENVAFATKESVFLGMLNKLKNLIKV